MYVSSQKYDLKESRVGRIASDPHTHKKKYTRIHICMYVSSQKYDLKESRVGRMTSDHTHTRKNTHIYIYVCMYLRRNTILKNRV